MDLYPYNTEAFIKYCIQKAMKESISEEGENTEASKAFQIPVRRIRTAW
jgi:hypothetical protein